MIPSQPSGVPKGQNMTKPQKENKPLELTSRLAAAAGYQAYDPGVSHGPMFSLSSYNHLCHEANTL